jgi:hypothetical protein
MDTTRKYPRTLADAFPDERYPAIEGYRRETFGHRVLNRFMVVLAVVLVGAISVGFV